MTDRFLVVLDSLARAASDIRRFSNAVRDGLVGALESSPTSEGVATRQTDIEIVELADRGN